MKHPRQRKPCALDEIIGANIRKFRREANLTQEILAELLGVSFQQLQKYEQATNRISASRLYGLASVLKKDIREFYQSGES